MKMLMCALLGLASAGAWAQEEKEHARARFIAESKCVAPGEMAWFGIHFDIDEHWHLYWNGVNDSGFAPQLKLQLPEGYKAGDTLWPAPKRLVHPGEILDHVYEGQVSLIFPVKVAADAKPGSTVEFKASPEWLVCHEVCLPGSAELKLEVRIGSADDAKAASADAPLFAKARQRIPKAIPKQNPPLTLWCSDGKVGIQAAGAGELAFYPQEGGVSFPNLIKEGQRKGERLVLAVKTAPEGKRVLKGVVEVKPLGGGPPILWTADVDLETLNKQAPPASNTEPRPRGD